VIPSSEGLIEGCLEAFKADCGWPHDMGAAGSLQLFEMAAKGGLGIELDLEIWCRREGNGNDGLRVPALGNFPGAHAVRGETRPREALDGALSPLGLQAAVVGRVLEENVVRVLPTRLRWRRGASPCLGRWGHPDQPHGIAR